MTTTSPKRRRYLVNPRYQLRWSLLIGLVGGLIASILVSLFWVALAEHDAVLEDAMRAEASLHEASGDVAVLLLNMPETTPEEAKVLKQKIDTQGTSFESGQRIKRELLAHNARLRWQLVGFVILVVVSLFAWGIVITHRVAGPLYVIKTQLATYRSSGSIEPRKLRRGDEFQEVYDELQRALGNDDPAG